MKKWNKKQFLITSFVIFLPTIIGFLLWDRLPDRLITHWNAAGEADGSMGKLAAITVTPLIIFAMHLFTLLMVHLDPSNENQSSKALRIAYWAMPVTSIFAGCMILGHSLGAAMCPTNWMNFFFGLLILLCGNYLPKCKPNSAVGIRLPWTLKDEDIWHKTHRMGGKVWLAGGLFLLLASVLSERIQMPLLFLTMLILCAVPSVYAYRLNKQKQRP